MMQNKIKLLPRNLNQEIMFSKYKQDKIFASCNTLTRLCVCEDQSQTDLIPITIFSCLTHATYK